MNPQDQPDQQKKSDFEVKVGDASVKASGDAVKDTLNMMGLGFIATLVADVFTDGDVDLLGDDD